MNRGCGVGARHIGIPGWIYRITPTSNGDIIQDSNKQFQIFADRAKMRRLDPAFESAERLETFWFELLLDALPLQLGDIWVINDPYLNVGAVTVPFPTTQYVGFVMAAMPPIKHAIAARVDTNARLYRPNLTPTTTNLGGTNMQYFDSTLPAELPVRCVNGQFQLGEVGQIAATIPIGTMPLNNTGNIYNQPTANVTSQERRRVYVPPLNGFTPKAGDQMILDNGSRYILISNYGQDVGTVGGQYIAEKIVSGPAGGD
jgi:hypothetical protein